MTTELTLLAWTLVLAVVQIVLPAYFRNQETGLAYNVSARDTPGPPVGVLTARLRRAQANLLETLPVFIGAVLAIHVTAQEGPLSWWGAVLYLAARVLYVPLYAFGLPFLRSAVWSLSMLGLALIGWRLLLPA